MEEITSTGNRFLLLFGSQTGQAEAISEEFRDRARALGLNPDFQCMKGAGKSFTLERETLAVIVISTTGDGEAPDTARKLIRRLNKRTLTRDHLKSLSYCMLALGDSNYLNFCNCGKLFDKRLRELGAKPFQETAYADDAVGLEVTADPWLDDTLEYLTNFFEIEFKASLHNQTNMSLAETNMMNSDTSLRHSSVMEKLELSLPPLQQGYISIEYKIEADLNTNSVPLQNNLTFPSSASDIFNVQIVKGKILTTSPLVKEYVQLWFELPDTNISYKPGDAFGFIPQNDTTEVESILNCLELLSKADISCFLTSSEANRNVPGHLPLNATLRWYFLTCCDIRSPPKKTLLRSMAEYATHPEEKRRLLELCSRQGSSEFLKFIRAESLSILDLLKAFPSCCNTPVTMFLENLPRLQARYYSVANSPISSPRVFTTVFSVVTFQEGSGRHAYRTGVCTGFLKESAKQLLNTKNLESIDDLVTGVSELKTDDSCSILAFKRTSSSFILPEDHTVPIIMIGAGAGIAPFLGFLNHRKEQKKSGVQDFGVSWLYFGCRHSKHDFLFGDEFEQLRQEGMLTNFRKSFSRDEKTLARYVQDNISEDFPAIVELIDLLNAFVYVCGDAKNMAKGVANAFLEGYEKVKGVTNKEAQQWHLSLQKQKRYIQDIWL